MRRGWPDRAHHRPGPQRADVRFAPSKGWNLRADVSAGPRYTGTDLSTLAGQQGLSASPRLLRRWVQLGLIDRPEKHGLGRGRGTVATWSANQATLLVELLQAQRSGPSIGALCRVPVWLWLRWGDAYVPLRQVRRALRTWAEFARRPSWTDADRMARDVVALVAAPGVRRGVRRRLRQVIAEQASGLLESGELLAAARDVIDIGPGVTRGPVAAPLNAAGYAELVAIRNETIERLTLVADEELEAARAIYQSAGLLYDAEQPTLAEDAELGAMFGPRDAQAEIGQACIDLITIVGFEHRRRGALSTETSDISK